MDSTFDMEMRNAFMIQTKRIVEGLALPAVGCIGIFGNILKNPSVIVYEYVRPT